MSFQTQVFTQPGFGVPGEIFDAGPTRAEPYILNSSDAANNVFGRAFTIVDAATNPQIAQAGGTGVFAGILVNPKAAALFGTSAGGTLAPSLAVPNYTVGELLNMGSVIVALTANAVVGSLVTFNQTTGVLGFVAPLTAPPSGFSYAGAVVDRVNVGASPGLGVIKITDVPNLYF